MLRRILFGFLFLGLGFINGSFAQVDSAGLRTAMKLLDKALIEKDKPVLQRMLHTDVIYGHSSGWVQSKTDIFNDFKTGKLVYNKIETSNSKILTINKKRAIAGMDINAEGLLNGTKFNLSMHVMQVWVKTKKVWQLLARQSGKM